MSFDTITETGSFVAACASEALAISGGTPVRTASYPRWPFYQPDELHAVQNVLASGRVNYWTGEEGREFEAEYANYLGIEHTIAVANGTVALELCLRALGIGPGDEVITTSRTFVASASCAVACGATPVFADVDLDSQNLTASTIEECVTERSAAIVAVHLAGWPCEMDLIMSLANRYGLAVIEDCAQAHGAQFQGEPVGSIGDMAAFSFCQDKIITTGGEGGLIATRHPALWRRAWTYKDHGKNYDLMMSPHEGQSFRWVHQSCGTNLRLTELQAALGRVQLGRLDRSVAVRRRHASALNAALTDCPGLRVTVPPAQIDHAYYKYYVFIRPERLRPGWSRDRIVEAIRAEGIPCQSGSCSEIYLEKAFDRIRPACRRPNAALLGQTSLMFQVHPTLSAEDIEDAITAIRKVMSAAAD